MFSFFKLVAQYSFVNLQLPESMVYFRLNPFLTQFVFAVRFSGIVKYVTFAVQSYKYRTFGFHFPFEWLAGKIFLFLSCAVVH